MGEKSVPDLRSDASIILQRLLMGYHETRVSIQYGTQYDNCCMQSVQIAHFLPPPSNATPPTSLLPVARLVVLVLLKRQLRVSNEL